MGGNLERALPSSSTVRRLMIGIPKANVFPVPVFARAMMSRPSKAGISTALCVVDNYSTLRRKKKKKEDEASWCRLTQYLSRKKDSMSISLWQENR